MQDSPAREQAPNHWEKLVRHWSNIGYPLQPCAEDIAVYERFAERAAREGKGGLRALLLGVTPKIAASRWPEGTALTAIDNSPWVIEALWPAPGTPDGARVICADWRAMPIASGAIGFAVGDGCNSGLPFPGVLGAISGEVARVLRPGGLFLFRVFVRPDPAETVDDVACALASGRIGSVHVLKWRLVGALCRDAERGVRLGDVWAVWNDMRRLTARLGERPGWTAAEIETMDYYRHSDTRFYFPTLAQIRALMARDFADIGYVCGGYELAHQCPILVCVKQA